MTPYAFQRFFLPPVALVIDDEEGIRHALTRLLESSGYKVFAAASGAEGLAMQEERGKEIALCICDFKMPGLDGIHTLTELGKRDPHLIRVLLTGYATLDAAIEATNQGLDAFITKPYQVRELRTKLDDLFARKAQALAWDTLSGVPLFSALPRDVLPQILSVMTPRQVGRGTVIQELGRPADSLFIVRDGEVAIEAHDAGGRLRPVSWLGPGEHVGEFWATEGEPSAVRAVASLDCELLALSREELQRQKSKFPTLAESAGRALSRRLAGVLGGKSRSELVLGCTGPYGSRAAERLGNALARLQVNAALLVLEPQNASAPSTKPAANSAAMNGEVESSLQLSRVDRDGLAVYSDAGNRSRASLAEALPRMLGALRQRHRVIVIALPDPPHDAASDPLSLRAHGQVHRTLHFADLKSGTGAKNILRVEVSPHAGGPSAAGFHMHLHAPELETAGPQMRIVARRLLGAAFGIALSCGNVRGIAHVGVLRALQRAGIELDAIAGCSIGSAIGGLYSLGTDLEQVLAVLRRPELRTLSAPKLQLSKAPWKRARELCEEIFAGKSFEQSVIPFICNAVDLESGESVIFETGEIADAVNASMATPPLFPPHYVGGRSYGDGGLLNGLPADLLAPRGLDLVLAIDVMFKGNDWKSPPPQRGGFTDGVIAVMPSMLRYAAMASVIERAINLSIRELINVRFTAASFTIAPEFDVNPVDWKEELYPTMVAAGERAIDPLIDSIRERRQALLARWS